MFLSRITRAVFGNPAAAPSEAAPRPLTIEDVLAIGSPVLRGYFEDRYRNPIADRDAAAREFAAVCAATFDGDPMPIAIELIRRAPLVGAFNDLDRSDASRRLASAYEGVTGAAFQAVTAHHADDWPVATSDLPAVLDALAMLVAQNHCSCTYGYGLWLKPLIRTAVSRGEAGVRLALIEMFAGFFLKPRLNVNVAWTDSVLRLTDELLPLTDIARREIGPLAEYDQKIANLEAGRARLLADAGEPLATAIGTVLDCGHTWLTVAEKTPAFRTLAELTPVERGAALAKALDVLADPRRYGVEKWDQLRKVSGRFTLDGRFSDNVGLANIAGTLAIRKVEGPDLDGTVAKLVAALERYWNLTHKRILTLILDTARAHPHGKTVAAIRAAGSNAFNSSARASWRAEIEDMLRDLPVATAAAPVAVHPVRTPVPIAGFGRKGGQVGSQGTLALEMPAAATPAPVPMPVPLIADLPSIAPPKAQITWDTETEIGTHFDNMLDVRLHDPAHVAYLARFTAAESMIGALTGDEPRPRSAAILAIAKQCGLLPGSDHDTVRSARVVENTVRKAAEIALRYRAVAPFVMAHPEGARALGKLAFTIAQKSAPPPKWLADARAALASIDLEEKLSVITALAAAPSASSGWNGCNEACSRAILYLATDLDTARVGKVLTEFALKSCYRTEAGVGIRAEKLGNACVWALSNMPEGSGVPYLARILARTKYPKIRAKIDAALNDAAERAGLSRAALDELIVPTHDLDAHGEVAYPLGGGRAVIALTGNRDTEIRWMTAEGKTVKSPSTAMKADKAMLKAVKEAAKEIEADLGTQVVRLQRLWLDDRSWPAAEWRERYLEHPLLRALSRRLIWWVERDGRQTAAMPSDGTLTDVTGRAVDIEEATIRLWHPIEDDVAGVHAWRDRIEALEVVQPFAQAWREVYCLTDAERATATYSNRWAGHILKQHQAMTLARVNRWTVTHRMWVDAPNDQPWHLTLPAHGLVADYWVEGTGGDDPEVTESCAYVYVATDRVSFYRIAEGASAKDSARGPVRGDALPLDQLPPLVFSEVMRHCDLLTGVASIASDPQWLDGGAAAHHPNQWRREAATQYWTSAATGELEGAGKIRRELLERIVPRLAFAAQLSLDAQGLLVQGKRHLYRIHLGSAAVHIVAQNRHVCIVPASAETAPTGVYLPFEGDRTLSIILSKALLLARDDKITDPVILNQI